MSETKKRGYFAQMFYKGYFLYALLFAAIFSALLISTIDIKLLSSTVLSTNLLFTINLLIAYFLAITVISSFPSVFGKRLSLYDAFYLACAFTGIIYFVYFFLLSDAKISLMNYILAGSFFGIGLIFTVISAITSKKEVENTPKETASHIKKYFSGTAKHSCFLVNVGLSVLITTCVFLAIYSGEILAFDKTTIILSAVCALPLILCAILGSSSKNTGYFDTILTTLILSILPVVFMIVTREYSAENKTINYAIAIAFAVLVLFFTFIRICTSNDEATLPQITAKTCFGSYFKQVSRKYGICLPLAIGGVLVFTTQILFPYTKLLNLYSQFMAVSAQGAFFIPYAIVNIASYFALTTGLILSIANVSARRVTFGDFALLVCASYSALSIAVLIVQKSYIPLIACAVALFVSLTLLASRIKNAVQN